MTSTRRGHFRHADPRLTWIPSPSTLSICPSAHLSPRAAIVAAVFANAKVAADGLPTLVSPDWPPVIVSDYADSAETSYEQARMAANTAETIEQFSIAIDLCKSGLDGAPPLELTLALRRLAAWAHNRRGELRNDAGEQKDALADFQAAIALDPSSWAAVHNRGVTLAEQGQTAAALRDFNRVLELNPGLTLAYRNRAELLASIGRMGEAVRDYTRALNQSPDDAELFRGRGYAWQRLGDFDRALADLDNSTPPCARSARYLHPARQSLGRAGRIRPGNCELTSRRWRSMLVGPRRIAAWRGCGPRVRIPAIAMPIERSRQPKRP